MLEEKSRKKSRGLTDANWMRQMMRVQAVQHALQDGTHTWQADALKLGIQEIGGEAVEHVEQVSVYDSALSHKHFLCCEQGCIELALRQDELAVYGERPCCVCGKE